MKRILTALAALSLAAAGLVGFSATPAEAAITTRQVRLGCSTSTTPGSMSALVTYKYDSGTRISTITKVSATASNITSATGTASISGGRVNVVVPGPYGNATKSPLPSPTTGAYYLTAAFYYGPGGSLKCSTSKLASSGTVIG